MSTSPQRLGKYELQQRLGQGGMAEVWKAFDPQLRRHVAIKLLHMNLQADPHFITRFQREAQLIAALHHPNIVQIHDFQIARPPETESSIAYMVMDYVEGQTLADYIRTTSARGQTPAPIDIVNFFTSISLAIDYAHQQGMIHRDIKPANILLDKRDTRFNTMGEPILTDFGLAKLLGMSTSAISGAQLGTPLYISPEQAQGLPGDARSDLYSLGVILYEMVTGVTPFQGNTPVAVIAQHAEAMPPSPALINPRVPPALASVILRCLAKDPNERFPNAAAMTVAIANALNIPIPERLGSPTDRLNPANTPRLFSPLPPGQQSSGRIPAVSSFPGPTLADSSQNLPIVTPAQPHPMAASGGQVPLGQVPLPASQTGPQYAASAAFAQSALNYPPQAATPSPPPLTSLASSSMPQPQPASGRRLRRLYILFVVPLIVVLIGAGLGAYFLFFRHSNITSNVIPPNQVVGHASFFSSGQLNPGSAQGIADELEIDLTIIPNAHPGKSYYAWLLGDIHPSVEANPLEPPPQFTLPLLLGPLTVNNGAVHFLYKGDSQHDNLFSVTSRLLITEEDTNVTPRSPSTDRSTWRYYAEIPQTPYGTPPLSALDHIRHLFYKETKVDVLGLPGGLDIWLYRDTEKLLEWAVSARDAWQNTPTDRSQFIRILDYLDGGPNVHVDLPPSTPVLTDPTAAKVGLLEVDPANQGANANLANNPPGYVLHVALHVNGVINAPDATPQMRQIGTQIIAALNNATVWLKQAHNDARQLFNMTDNQLRQPSTLALLDDLVTQATYAYIGRLDPTTDQVQPGILQVHYDVQQLATFTITSNIPNSL